MTWEKQPALAPAWNKQPTAQQAWAPAVPAEEAWQDQPALEGQRWPKISGLTGLTIWDLAIGLTFWDDFTTRWDFRAGHQDDWDKQ